MYRITEEVELIEVSKSLTSDEVAELVLNSLSDDPYEVIGEGLTENEAREEMTWLNGFNMWESGKTYRLAIYVMWDDETGDVIDTRAEELKL